MVPVIWNRNLDLLTTGLSLKSKDKNVEYSYTFGQNESIIWNAVLNKYWIVWRVVNRLRIRRCNIYSFHANVCPGNGPSRMNYTEIKDIRHWLAFVKVANTCNRCLLLVPGPVTIFWESDLLKFSLNYTLHCHQSWCARDEISVKVSSDETERRENWNHAFSNGICNKWIQVTSVEWHCRENYIHAFRKGINTKWTQATSV